MEATYPASEPMNPAEPENITPTRHSVEFQVDGSRLEGLIVEADAPEPTSLLILGGGGNIPHKEGYYPIWQERLATAAGMSSMSFDYRGVGSSDGEMHDTGLQTRLADARAALVQLKQACPAERTWIWGVSMGGPLAIQLAIEAEADVLVLVAPAAYSQKAHDQPRFGEEFRAALREENSWMDSPDFEGLENFKGRVLLVYGEQDTVIPAGVLQRYAEITRSKGSAGQVLAFSETGHRFMQQTDPPSQAVKDELLAAMTQMAQAQ